MDTLQKSYLKLSVSTKFYNITMLLIGCALMSAQMALAQGGTGTAGLSSLATAIQSLLMQVLVIGGPISLLIGFAMIFFGGFNPQLKQRGIDVIKYTIIGAIGVGLIATVLWGVVASSAAWAAAAPAGNKQQIDFCLDWLRIVPKKIFILFVILLGGLGLSAALPGAVVASGPVTPPARMQPAAVLRPDREESPRPALMPPLQPPTPTPTPEPGGWPSWLPTIPTPTEIIMDILEVLATGFIDALTAWLHSLVQTVLDWVSANWELDGSGLLGTLTSDIFNFSVTLGVPFMVVAVSLAFVQQWLIRLFPGLFQSLGIGQVMGRLIIVAMAVNPYALTFQIGLMKSANEMAFNFLFGGGGGDWGWMETIVNLIVSNPEVINYFGLGFVLGIIMLVMLIACVVVKQLLAVLVVGVMPLAAVAWLFPLTQGLWSKYWWMFAKLALFPFLVAFVLRVTLAVLQIIGGNLLVGLGFALIIEGAGVWLMLKFLLMPETIMLGLGGALTAVGAGAIGGPMMGSAAMGYARRAGLGREANLAHRAIASRESTPDE